MTVWAVLQSVVVKVSRSGVGPHRAAVITEGEYRHRAGRLGRQLHRVGGGLAFVHVDALGRERQCRLAQVCHGDRHPAEDIVPAIEGGSVSDGGPLGVGVEVAEGS